MSTSIQKDDNTCLSGYWKILHERIHVKYLAHSKHNSVSSIITGNNLIKGFKNVKCYFRENEIKARAWEFRVTKRKHFLIMVPKRSMGSFLKEDFKNRSVSHLPGVI